MAMAVAVAACEWTVPMCGLKWKTAGKQERATSTDSALPVCQALHSALCNHFHRESTCTRKALLSSAFHRKGRREWVVTYLAESHGEQMVDTAWKHRLQDTMAWVFEGFPPVQTSSLGDFLTPP